jgi:hypothetical protein
MQRQVEDGIIIACDFCGTDWDEVRPMSEGHKGSVICLECLEKALADRCPADDGFDCTLCRRPYDASTIGWSHPSPGPDPNPDARVCTDCVAQAAKLFSADKDVDFEWKET